MTVKVTAANGGSDSVDFINASGTTLAQVKGYDDGSSNGHLELYTTASGTSTERVRVTSAGNVGIGTSSPTTKLNVVGGRSDFYANSNAFSIGLAYNSSSGNYYIGATTGATPSLVFSDTTATERMRIDSSGNLLVGTTDSSAIAGAGVKLRPSSTNPDVAVVHNTASNQGAFLFYNTNATNNGYRFYVTTNGGISNYSGNNSNLSDERTKKNIEVSGSYLDKICAIPVKLFNYKDEAEGEQRTLGLIAQDVEAVAPELVNLEGFGETPEDGVPLKSIYTTDMMFALMKCIQELAATSVEQQALISSQAAAITALTERINALEAK